ncbi:hypothetical protein ROHU_030065 [Labeo rohita]|uniref:Uncharacterized protein n=1 Tax=Labeo rohita TaxID=84645 RepID=A0A498LSE2_LABRO|nr:hypothetical protein ROHU_030065 [Labeo rohita]
MGQEIRGESILHHFSMPNSLLLQKGEKDRSYQEERFIKETDEEMEKADFRKRDDVLPWLPACIHGHGDSMGSHNPSDEREAKTGTGRDGEKAAHWKKR